MAKQKYEEYWKLTLEYTDIHSDKFRGTLKIIIDFISENKITLPYQKEVYEKYPKSDMGSVRKSINQFVKLGFVNSLSSYNVESIEFLEAKTKRRRETIFSTIVYKYSSFSSSITNYIEQKEINFLLKTLEEVGSLSKENIIGLMTVEITKYQQGYINANDLNYYTEQALKSGFIKRKYNQVGYLFNLLKKLDDIVFVDNLLYFEQNFPRNPLP